VEGLSTNQLLDEALSKNVDLVIAEQQILLSQMDIRINKTSLKPAITANGSLGLLGAANSPKASIKNQFIADFGLGVGLNWNIFDGGYNKVRDSNLKILLDNQEILREQKSHEIQLNILNAWETLQNQLYLMKVEERNMETARLNFERTSEQFNLGQVSSIEFRQAQLNQLSAQLSYNRAKLNAKVNELTLLLNSGRIFEGI
jgi:outer membrane protein TolC